MDTIFNLVRENPTLAAAISAVIVLLILRRFLIWALIIAGLIFVGLYYLYGKIPTPL